MFQKKFSVFALAAAGAWMSTAFAGTLPGDRFSCVEGFELGSYTGKKTFLELMKDEVQPAMDRVADGNRGRLGNQEALDKGRCVTIRLNRENSTWHVNYPKDSEMGGRSYSLGPGGKVNDPSDKEYLDFLDKVIHGNPDELKEFYAAIIKVIANCDTSGYRNLNDFTQVVATDFISVYAAEEKRHLVGNLGSFKWDDALLQVTLIGAFHGGQSDHRMFYEGKFTSQVYDQSLKAYKQPENRAGKDKRQARMREYWQWSKNDPNRSGINLTRRDVEKMGEFITLYSRESERGRQLLADVERLIGVRKSKNIFSDIAKFFISKKSPPNMSNVSDRLAKAISEYLGQVHDDAGAITSMVMNGAE
ncbi:MAG: hypothetical protein AB7P04_03975 [Bacteriovoracia bacterium]